MSDEATKLALGEKETICQLVHNLRSSHGCAPPAPGSTPLAVPPCQVWPPHPLRRRIWEPGLGHQDPRRPRAPAPPLARSPGTEPPRPARRPVLQPRDFAAQPGAERRATPPERTDGRLCTTCPSSAGECTGMLAMSNYQARIFPTTCYRILNNTARDLEKQNKAAYARIKVKLVGSKHCV